MPGTITLPKDEFILLTCKARVLDIVMKIGIRDINKKLLMQALFSKELELLKKHPEFA